VSTLHVRQVPEDVYDALKQRAAENESSISAEVIHLLRRALAVDRTGVRELLDEVEAKRPKAGRKVGMAAKLIRGDRERR
jgi:plasmid stability protein